MKKFFAQLSEFNKSVLLSVAFHIFLILLFLLFRSGLNLPDQEFAEVGFVASTTSRAYKPATTKKSEPEKTQSAQVKEEAAGPSSTQPKEEAKAPPVNVPKRRMLEEDEPELTKRDSGKLTPSQDDKISPQDDVYDSDTMEKSVAERASSGKDFSDPMGSSETGKDASPASDVGSSTSNQPYTLEGDASKRTIINQVLPEYPTGLQREAVVKIRFWVQPDGRIGSMIPVRKGDPKLEDITMKAIRQWRFNALPADEQQKNVEGVITFVYKLQ